jgi:hypothetical protein
MSNDRYARYAAASGIIATVLIVGAFLGLVLPNAPDTDASATAWASYYVDHGSRLQVGVVVAGVGLFFFAWFLGSIRSALATAEGGQARLTSVAFGGGILGIATLLVALTSGAAAAFRPTDVDPTITRALNDIGVVAGGPGAAGFTAFFAAIAIVGYRYNAVPAPIAGFSALAAITQPLAFGVAVTDSGVFAADGVLGGFVPILTFVIAMVTLSVALVRRPEGYATGPAGASPQYVSTSS